MAVAYQSASLLAATPQPVNVPFTLACFFRAADAGPYRTLLFAYNQAGGPHHWLFLSDGYVHAQTKWAGTGSTSRPYTPNAWSHACAVFAASNERRVYLDGGSQGTDRGNAAWEACDRITALDTPFYTAPLLGGAIAEAAVWLAALGEAEIAALAGGACPPRIRPNSLIAYWPLGGHFGPRLVDRWKQRRDLALSGSVSWIEHPRVWYGQGVRVAGPGRPAGPCARPPHRVAAGRLWHTGAAVGQVFVSTQTAGQIHG